MPQSIGGGLPRTDAHYARWVCGFLLLANALIYLQTLGFSLLFYDDDGFVQANPRVTAGLTIEGIRWAFSEGPYGEWYPLAPLSHMLDCQLFGLNAWGHHLTNVLLHAAGSIVLFLVWWRMTDALWPSALVATLFAVHPQHVESVAWVAERRDVLSGLFFMLTLAAYLGYVRHGRPIWRYLLVAAMLALGLMAKPMLVTVPPLLLLLDFWPLARLGRADDVPHWTRSIECPGTLWVVLEKLPLLALAVADCLATMRTHSPIDSPIAWPVRLSNAMIAPITYAVKFFYPVDLAVFYPYPASGLPTWQVAGAAASVVLLSAAAVIWRRRCPYLFVGWFWYLGMLAPVLGLVQVSDHSMADRYTYLPSIGLSVAVIWGATGLFAGPPLGRRLLVTGAAAAIVLLVALAIRQTSFWRDDETLWRHAVAATDANSKAEVSLANALNRQGRRDEAVEYYLRAQQHPADPAPFYNLGRLLEREGRLDEAIVEYRLAVDKFPDWYLAEVDLADALGQKGNLAEANEHIERALKIDPHGVPGLIVLSHLLVHEGKLAEAATKLEEVVAAAPANASAQTDLGAVYFKQGQAGKAIRCYDAALAINPYLPLAHANRATALATLGKIGEAVAEYRRALQLDPKNRAARIGLDTISRQKANRPDQPGR